MVPRRWGFINCWCCRRGPCWWCRQWVSSTDGCSMLAVVTAPNSPINNHHNILTPAFLITLLKRWKKIVLAFRNIPDSHWHTKLSFPCNSEMQTSGKLIDIKQVQHLLNTFTYSVLQQLSSNTEKAAVQELTVTVVFHNYMFTSDCTCLLL